MYKIIKRMRIFVVLSLLLSITACGFHLRGDTALGDGAQTVYISGIQGSFSDKLHDALVSSGAQVANSRSGVDMLIDITQAQSNRRVGTLDERGKVDSYQLFFTVTYSVFGSDGNLISEPKVIKENRQYVFSPDLVLESEFEERALVESMEDDAVVRLIRQVSVLSKP